MEGFLRGKKMPAVAVGETPRQWRDTWDACYDLNSGVVFFPIRHHSPACTLHLQRTMALYHPDTILIEGPADSDRLIPHIGHPDNKAPLCLYYTHIYKDHEAAQQEGRSACYYPLLDFSPELAAIRYGVAHGIKTCFIDLPYAQLDVLQRKAGQMAKDEKIQDGKQKDGEKASYYDEYYMRRSAFIARLCDKQGCRHYSELWEKLFEMGGPLMDTPEFVRSMLAICHYSRMEYPELLLEQEGCLARERKMAAEILAAKKTSSRILVVTGGFHTAALHTLIQGEMTPEPIEAGKGACYLIPYSFPESDQLAGYASGMPYPAFYQAIHEGLEKKPDTAYQDAVLLFLARIGGRLRSLKETISIADEVAAVQQARGLAALREKPQTGVYELLDGVRSAYVKGDMNLAASVMLSAAAEVLRGDRMGCVSSGAELVPLLRDFRETGKRLRLKMEASARRELVLNILTKPVHRETSAFLHRLCYLNVGFGVLKAGPDYRSRDTTLVREKWEYATSAHVESQVIDAAHLGGTLREATSTALGQKRREFTGCGEYSRMLIDAAIMDLTEHTGPLLVAMEGSIANDGDFGSLVLCARNLLFLENAKWLLSLPDAAFADRLLDAVYRKAVAILPTLGTSVEKEDREIAKSLKDLYQISRREGVDESLFYEALTELTGRARPLPPPVMRGAAVGMLYACEQIDSNQAADYAASYFFGTGEEMKCAGRFLSGIFLTAWDIIFQDGRFLRGISHILQTVDSPDFLTLLPDLRLAFSTFSPSQTDRIAQLVADLLEVGEEDVLVGATPEPLLSLGRELDAYATKRLEGVSRHDG